MLTIFTFAFWIAGYVISFHIPITKLLCIDVLSVHEVVGDALHPVKFETEEQFFNAKTHERLLLST